MGINDRLGCCRHAVAKVLWHMPCMRATLRACGAKRVKFWMCSYGASSLKPTVLLASLAPTCIKVLNCTMAIITLNPSKDLVYTAQHREAPKAAESEGCKDRFRCKDSGIPKPTTRTLMLQALHQTALHPRFCVAGTKDFRL